MACWWPPWGRSPTQFEATGLVVHNTSLGGRERASTSLRGDVDAAFRLKDPVLENDKQQDDETGLRRRLQLEQGELSGDPNTGRQAAHRAPFRETLRGPANRSISRRSRRERHPVCDRNGRTTPALTRTLTMTTLSHRSSHDVADLTGDDLEERLTAARLTRGMLVGMAALAAAIQIAANTPAVAATPKPCHTTKPGACVRGFDPCDITCLKRHPKFAAYSMVGAWNGYDDNDNSLNPHGAAGKPAFPAWRTTDLNLLLAVCPPNGHNKTPYPPKKRAADG